MIAAFFLGTGAAAFPQLFVLARRYLVGTRDIEHGTPVLRSTWSIAWAIGPVTGGALQAWQGFVGLFLAASLAFGLVALPVLMLGAGPGGEAVTAAPCGEPTPPDPSLLPVVISFTLFHTAMFSGSVILPLWMTQALHRPYSDVGLTFSVCAGVECLAALVVALRPPRIAKERVILLGIPLCWLLRPYRGIVEHRGYRRGSAAAASPFRSCSRSGLHTSRTCCHVNRAEPQHCCPIPRPPVRSWPEYWPARSPRSLDIARRWRCVRC